MAGPTVTLAFAGDSARIEKSMANVGSSAKKMASDLDAASDKATFAGKAIGQAGDAADNSESKFMGTADVLDGLGAAFGLPTEAATGMFRAFGDLSGGFAQLQGLFAAGADKVVAFGKAVVSGEIVTKAWAATQAGFNAVMALNPAILIAGAVIALGAALVIAYKNSETFRNIVKGAFDVVKGAAEAVMNFFTGLPGKIGALGGQLFDVITWPYKTAFNAIAKLWNNTVGNLSFSVPSWVPGLGGKGFSMPKLPTFHTGGVVPGPIGLPQPIMALGGETVLTRGQAAGGGGPQTIILQVDGRELARVVTDQQRGNAARGFR